MCLNYSKSLSNETEGKFGFKGGEGGGLVDHGADQQPVINEGEDSPVGDEPWVLLQDDQIPPALVLVSFDS